MLYMGKNEFLAGPKADGKLDRLMHSIICEKFVNF